MKKTSLPENAYRELKDGEEYQPIMSADTVPAEATPYSVTMGIIMAIIFSAAAAFLGLKVGQVFEAAIPIAIIAVGLGGLHKGKSMLGQNVIIQSIGATSGVIVAGAIFTLPALYILGLEAHFYQVFLSSLLGGILGIVLLIPFRKYFVKQMHGKYPFPEATATTEVLVSGEKGGKQTIVLALAGLIGGLYDFAVSTFGAWAENISTKMMGWGVAVADKFKVEFSLNTGATLLGLGYIIGLKYAVIITAGSCLVWFVIVPLVGYASAEAAAMSANDLFMAYGRPIGIGGIAMAGLIGIIRQAGIIKDAAKLAVNELGGKKGAVAVARTDKDIAMKTILTIIIATLVATLVFFQFGVLGNWLQTVVALLIVFVIAFLFTTVAANAIAIVGSNPVSGMTLMTLILSSLVLVSIGLNGTIGMTAALIIGGVVCTALSMAGGFITDLKIGYWLGTTPATQEKWKFLGTIVSAATVAGVMIILNKTYGFTGENALAAPQATDPRVVVMERTNIRYVTLEQLGEPLDLSVIDVSFISLKIVLPAIKALLKPGQGQVLCLIKPQFEAGKEKVGKKGVVREPETHKEVLDDFVALANELQFNILGLTFSPVKGPEGNIEFLGHLTLADVPGIAPDTAQIVSQAHQTLRG